MSKFARQCHSNGAIVLAAILVLASWFLPAKVVARAWLHSTSPSRSSSRLPWRPPSCRMICIRPFWPCGLGSVFKQDELCSRGGSVLFLSSYCKDSLPSNGRLICSLRPETASAPGFSESISLSLTCSEKEAALSASGILPHLLISSSKVFRLASTLSRSLLLKSSAFARLALAFWTGGPSHCLHASCFVFSYIRATLQHF